MTPMLYSDEQHAILAEAGFTLCFVEDIAEGDTIAIGHEVNPDAPTEMVVADLRGMKAKYWIGRLPDGRERHCEYLWHDPCWRQPRDGEEGTRPAQETA